MKNKTLKEKREELFDNFEVPDEFIEIIRNQDKQFIEDLKDKTKSWPDGYDRKSHKFRDLIDKLAGDLE